MKGSIYWISFALLSLTFLSRSLYPHMLQAPNSILDLTEKELKEKLAHHNPVIIMAYMTTCSHCKTTLETLERLKRKYKQIEFYLVNGPEKHIPSLVQNLTNKEFKIIGYPSLLYIKNGKIQHVQTGGMTSTIEKNIENLLSENKRKSAL